MNKKLKSIKELREAYRKTYNKYSKEFNQVAEDFKKLNEKLIPLSQEVDEILAVMEKTYDLSE